MIGSATGGTRLFRIRLWFANAMWVPVLAANLLAVAVGVLAPVLDAELAERPAVPIALSAVEQILGAIATGMITFTGIVFSAVFVAAQIQTSSYSPRVAAELRRDPVIIAGLALPTATASYALFALAVLGRQSDASHDVAPAITVLLALLLTFATFAGFVALVQRTFDNTQIGGILRSLMRNAHRVIADVHPLDAPDGVAVEFGGAAVEVCHDGPPAVVAAVDRAALVGLAAATGSTVEVLPRVGQYVFPGAVVLRLHGAAAEPDGAVGRDVLVLARQRTMKQDPGFALRMLVDIAIRGLSPAVNDPTTAVQTIDRIEALLVELHRRKPGPSIVVDADGAPRGVVPGPTWVEYLDLGLVEIRHYGARSAQVARRLHALYGHLLEVAPEARERIERERDLLDAALADAFPDPRERALLSQPDRLGLGHAGP